VTVEAPWRAAYYPALERTWRALAVAAVVTEAVEQAAGPHRVISAIFFGIGLLTGYVAGRVLARQLRDWAQEAPLLDDVEATRLRASEPSPLTVAALAVIGVLAVVIPLVWQVPTPLPGALAAGALQVLLEARVLRDIETQRGGEVVRPVGQISFDGSELRLRVKAQVGSS
jgi:hypothetical protein